MAAVAIQLAMLSTTVDEVQSQGQATMQPCTGNITNSTSTYPDCDTVGTTIDRFGDLLAGSIGEWLARSPIQQEKGFSFHKIFLLRHLSYCAAT